jgi:hypothetical protein
MHKASKLKSSVFPPPKPPRQEAIDSLLLDANNARLAATAPDGSQKDLLRVLWSEMAVAEVAVSIALNGYFPHEELLVIPHDTQANKFIVVEGNRRLAAVKLLRDESLRKSVGATDLDGVATKAKTLPDKLPVVEYPAREALWAYLGFQHVNGVRPWDAYSKASYVAHVHEDYGRPLATIAANIGDYHSTVKRLYRGFVVLRQAEAQLGFDKEDCARGRFYFSHLYTALDQKPFQEFLGIDPDKSLAKDPVPKDRLQNLRELMVWLYGRKAEKLRPVIQTQAPDLNILRDVIGNKRGLKALRTGVSLMQAYEATVGEPALFGQALGQAITYLEHAMRLVTRGYAGAPGPREDVRTIERLVANLKAAMGTSSPSSTG